jgi:hypothetical protein
VNQRNPLTVSTLNPVHVHLQSQPTPSPVVTNSLIEQVFDDNGP